MTEAQKVITQFPKPLLHEVDQFAGVLRMNRSAFLREAAEEKILSIKRKKIIDAARRATKENAPVLVRKLESLRKSL